MGRPRADNDPNRLTERAQEVFALLRDGLTNPQIAERLGISLETVKHHVSQVLSKLNLSTREDVAAAEPRQGLLALAPLRWLLFGASALAIALVIVLVLGVVLEDSGESTDSSAAHGETFRVEGAAMNPTFEDGELVAVNSYGSALPQRGDIVVFQPPTTSERNFIKRIVALPGDTIRIDHPTGELFVNDELVVESYVLGPTRCHSNVCQRSVPEPDVSRLPEFSPLLLTDSDYEAICGTTACYYVLGDNRVNSNDSRLGWLVPAENIIGWVEEPAP